MMTIEIKKPIKRQRTDSTAITTMAMVVRSSSHDHGDQENPASCFLDITRRQRGGYECKTCGKRFKSYQALGGHQGIHKRVKPVDENYDECELRLDIYVDPLNKSSFGMHQCKQCLKEFDSGQALGGHMRRHMVEKKQQEEEEKIARRQQAAASDEQGKSDLTQEPEQVSPAAEDYESRRKMIMRSELMLAAKEWRLLSL